MNRFSERYRAFSFGAIVLIALTLGFFILLPFVPAILWATVLSTLMYPLYRKSRERWAKSKLFGNGRESTVASLFATIATLVLICIPFALVAVGITLQLGGIGQDVDPSAPKNQPTLNSVMASVDKSVGPIAERFGAANFKVSEWFEKNKEMLAQNLRAPATKALTTTGYTVLTIVIALLTMFFMLRDGRNLREPALQLIPLPREKSESIIQRVGETIHAVFVGTVLVAIIQGTIIGITYYFVGIPNALLLGVISGILCIIPLLGAPVIYIPAGLLLLTQGNTTGAIWIFVIGFGVVSQIDNLLKPWFIGGRANLHPMTTFFAILGGVILLGPIGVMAGPMVLTILLALQDVIRERLALEAGEPAPVTSV